MQNKLNLVGTNRRDELANGQVRQREIWFGTTKSMVQNPLAPTISLRTVSIALRLKPPVWHACVSR